MPDPNSHEPEVTPVEFDFIAPATENPRIKRRSLKAKPATVLKPIRPTPPETQELAREAPPRSEPAITRPAQPAPPEEDDNAGVEIKDKPVPAKAPPAAKKSPQPQFASTARPSTTTPKPTSSPHGTRPATLYYSTGPRKEKEEPAAQPAPAAPMNTTPASSTTPATPATTRPAAAAVRPATVVDYRTNVDRQAREQKSVGGVLSIVVYVLIGFFVLGGFLACYGTYTLSKQIHKQSLTIDDLNNRYNAENEALTAKINATNDALTQSQTQALAQTARLQDLIVKQQDTINKLIAADNAATSALRTERQTRAEETASLRARLRNLEYKGPSTGTTTQRY